MTITLNGQRRETTSPTVKDLLHEVGYGERPVVVEHNQLALLPREHGTAELAEGDLIEVVQITAGG
jgi:sulfur carrier protein